MIITKNEEVNLPGCLESVSWADDIHVFDSFSEDKTEEIANAFGVKLSKRQFDNYANQRNKALQSKFKNPWVLILDADERVTPELKNEIESFVQSTDGSEAACRMRRRDYFMGTWLKRAQISPYFTRLVKPDSVHYEREVNEVLCVNGKIVEFDSCLDHFPFSKGIAHWVDKHNVYSTMEARLIESQVFDDGRLTDGLFAADFNERRVAQKKLFYKLPLRPLIKWLYMMFIRGAILDGKAGFHYAMMQSFYEYLIMLKSEEIKSIKNNDGYRFGKR